MTDQKTTNDEAAQDPSAQNPNDQEPNAETGAMDDILNDVLAAAGAETKGDADVQDPLTALTAERDQLNCLLYTSPSPRD